MIRINDLYASIQGEGVKTGVPMAVLRLMGCGVGCSWCDTKETWKAEDQHKRPNLSEALGANPLWAEAEEKDVVTTIMNGECGGLDWVLLTGGEPGEQQIAPLIAGLHYTGRKVAVETSGTASGIIGCGADWVTLSPKIGMPGGRVILPAVVAEAHEIKWVVGREEHGWKLAKFLKEHRDTLRSDVAVCVQPLSQSDRATALCVNLAFANGYRLSIQTHKYVGLR